MIGRAGDGRRAVAEPPTIRLVLPNADVGAPFDLDGRTGDWASPLEVVTRPRVGIAPFGGDDIDEGLVAGVPGAISRVEMGSGDGLVRPEPDGPDTLGRHEGVDPVLGAARRVQGSGAGVRARLGAARGTGDGADEGVVRNGDVDEIVEAVAGGGVGRSVLHAGGSGAHPGAVAVVEGLAGEGDGFRIGLCPGVEEVVGVLTGLRVREPKEHGVLGRPGQAAGDQPLGRGHAFGVGRVLPIEVSIGPCAGTRGGGAPICALVEGHRDVQGPLHAQT